MKAGAFTPAIRSPDRLGEGARQPLNEGGGFHPRNPRRLVRQAGCCRSLNEGGGFHPRNPCSTHLSGESFIRFAQ